ncbi:MAG: molybdenum cofactor guanylyltransferase [Nitrospinota bacterium]
MPSTFADSAPLNTVGGVVLAGGGSRRMGRDKAWLHLNGSSMLSRVVSAVQEGLGQFNSGAPVPLVVAAAPGQNLPPLPEKVLIVRDPVHGHGPLRGLETGLAALEGKTRAVYAASCDTPLLSAAFVERVVSLLGEADAAVPVIRGRYHPLAGAYRTALLPVIRRLLNAGERRPFSLLKTVQTRTLNEEELRWADPELQSLMNINTPDEYETVLKHLEGRS